MERGFRLDGGRINPSDKKLESAARVVGLDPRPLFELVGRAYTGPHPEVVSAQVDRLSAVERRLSDLEAKVDVLLAR